MPTEQKVERRPTDAVANAVHVLHVLAGEMEDANVDAGKRRVGCMGFGDDSPSMHGWSIDEVGSRPNFEWTQEQPVTALEIELTGEEKQRLMGVYTSPANLF